MDMPLIESMLLSKDEEIRKLAFNYIKINYDIDFKNPIVEEDLAKIEKKMKELASKNFKIERREVSKEEALEIFKDNEYKIELINEIKGNITVFTQGDFTDLCKGPHLLYTDAIKHFKLLNIAGSDFIFNPDLIPSNIALPKLKPISFLSATNPNIIAIVSGSSVVKKSLIPLNTSFQFTSLIKVLIVLKSP